MHKNMVLVGDNYDKTTQYLEKESIDLIYTDPLWKTNKEWLASSDIGTIGYYDDNFPTLNSYLDFLRKRIALWYEYLKPKGHLVLHVDSDFSAYIKTHVLDNVFSISQYRNTIIWSYNRWSATSKRYNKLHHDLLWYTKAKDNSYIFNEQRIPLNRSRKRNLVDGKTRTSLRDENGDIVYIEQTDRPIGDVWDDINPVPNTGGERVDYPTQKPVAIAERLIRTLTDEGGLVFDPFMGSGTTLVAAHRLKRYFIGIDNEETAVNKTRFRLEQEGASYILKNGSTTNIKGIDEMDDYEYQTHVVNALGGVVGPRGSDGGIDGLISSISTGVGVTKSQISRQKIALFATDLKTKNLVNGIFVSPIPASKCAIDEAARLRLAGEVNIEIKTDKDIFGGDHPSASLHVDGFVVRVKTQGFRYSIVNYSWSVNTNDDQTYLFGSRGVKIVNKSDRAGYQDFSKIFTIGDHAYIKCVVSDIKGTAVVAEISYKF